MSGETGQEGSHGTVEALLQEYAATGDPQLRDCLVLTFAPMITYIVSRKLSRAAAEFDGEPQFACGLAALIGAIDDWHPERDAQFEQYAWTRIVRAVSDEAPRHLRPVRRGVEPVSRAAGYSQRLQPV